MKSLFAVGFSAVKSPVFRLLACALPVIVASYFIGPVSAGQAFGGRANALGGAGAARAMSRPLGGFGPGNRGGFNRGARPNQGYPGYGYPYAYSFYVPDYFDYSDSSEPYPGTNPYAPAYYAPPAPEVAPVAPQQPIIINQYFGTNDPRQAGASAANATNTQTPGDPIGTPQNYYLIAYKNHTVYSALAYWVEGKTLNYVTMQNTHNQASLDLIDLPLTKSLNQDRAVPFSIPGQ